MPARGMLTSTIPYNRIVHLQTAGDVGPYNGIVRNGRLASE